MSAKVQIVVEAQDKASGPMKAIAGAFDGIRDRIASILSANMLENLGRQILQFGKDSVDATVKYADSVRDLQMVSGQTAEEASRMIQVFDDFKINIDSLTPAIRKMTSEGLTPNLATIAAMSDEYRALEDPLAKNTFLMDKFGRAGLGMAEMMSKGSDAILAMGASVDESLILTQQGVDQAREYEIALDNWNDSIEGVKISIGTKLIPVMTDLMNQMADGTRTQEILIEKYGLLGNQTEERIADARAQAVAEREAATALMDEADAATMAGGALEDLASVDYSKDVSFVLSFQSKTEDFDQKRDEILGKMEELRDKILATQEEIRLGTANAEALDPLRADMVELSGELNKNEADFKRWQKQAMFSLIQTKLAADGLTDVEFDQLMNIGEEMGVLDPAVVDQATAMLDSVTNVDPSGLEKAADKLKYIVGLDGKVVTIYINEVQTGEGQLGLAGGGSFTVPQGYPNDSFHVGLSSGENVTVSTPGQQAQMGTSNVYNIYGATILLQRGQEGGILAELTE